MESVQATAFIRQLCSKHDRFAVAAASGGDVVLDSAGVSLDADFEIGSLSKAITGLLYADACQRGEVGPDVTLGELLPLGDCPAAGLTLAAVSRHSSGLPRLPRPVAGSPGMLRRTAELWLHGANPYGETLAELLDQARRVRLRAPRPHYSNLGYELLGHAVAARAGLRYRELLRERLCVPLNLRAVYAPATIADLSPAALTGSTRSGRLREPWTGEALAPAGGIRASIRDMAGLLKALLDGTVPGLTALDPVADFAGPAVRIGAAWVTLDLKGRAITWHNGATGGFRSFIGLDREAGSGVVLLSASSQSLDGHGFDALQQLTGRR